MSGFFDKINSIDDVDILILGKNISAQLEINQSIQINGVEDYNIIIVNGYKIKMGGYRLNVKSGTFNIIVVFVKSMFLLILN